MNLHTILILTVFGLVCFAQNMAFTWSSRSRNSGDPDYHRFASWSSNGVYYITNALLTVYIVKTMDKSIWFLVLSGLIYTLTTAEGSVLMMRLLLRTEQGKRRAGTQFTNDEADKIRTLIEHITVEVAEVPVVAAESLERDLDRLSGPQNAAEATKQFGFTPPMPGQGARI